MSRYGAPGVYYQSVDAGALPVTPFRTDITGFVGIASRGPVDTAVPIESWRQFSTWFGEFSGAGYLAYAVRAFFENGGRRCWVVRVAAKDPATGATAATGEVSSATGSVWRVSASSEGTWGNLLAVSFRERNPGQTYLTTTNADGAWSTVTDLSHIARATHVRLSQSGRPTTWRVISGVDPHERRVYWVHPDARRRLAYDSPLTEFDPGRPVLLQSVEYTAIVSQAARIVRVYDGLTMVPESDNYGPTRLALRVWAEDRSSGAVIPVAPEPIVVDDIRTDPIDLTGIAVDPFANLPLRGGRDGLTSLAVGDFIGEPIAVDDGPMAVATKRRGLRVLESIGEVALLAVPDAQVRPVGLNPIGAPPPCIPDPCVTRRCGAAPVPDFVTIDSEPGELPPTFGNAELYRIQAEMIQQCEHLRDRFALLDAPLDAVQNPMFGTRAVTEWRSRFDSQFAALYFPWIRVLDPLQPSTGTIRNVPPSGHVAGLVAATDLDRGVHRAPANQRLEWALDATAGMNDEQHAALNEIGVNAIRMAVGRGLRVQGARTISSDPDWRFINVRRVVTMIEKALETGLQWAVFEPNGTLTRARASMAVTIFLLGLHSAGLFAGATPEESFFVRCDLDNNPEAERELGRLVIEIGLAPVKPFEFVVLRVGRVRDSLEVTDGAGSFGTVAMGV